jgi:hypothetical protein
MNNAAPTFAALSTSSLVPPSLLRPYSHVVVVIEENHDYSQIIGSSSAPYINGTLAAGGMILTNYLDIGHPSQPNYFALYAGSNFGTSDDNAHSEPDPTLATVLQSQGKSFIGYVEGLTAGQSDFNHDPWESFPQTDNNVGQDFSTFPTAAAGFAALPTVSFVIPTVNNDMHDPQGTIAQGDQWLQTNINGYAQWAQSNNSPLVVVWDEGGTGDQAPAILYGANVAAGTNGIAYNHYNMLSTVLEAAGVSNLLAPNNAANLASIAFEIPCFVAGTRIATPRGEVPVENLRNGDIVITHDGAYRPIRWLGHRHIDLSKHSDPSRVRPVRIRAGAIAPGQPLRDLLVSPDHAIFREGVLIPARLLINGASIVTEAGGASVMYYHIELDRHAILFADGLPAESYLDTGNRTMFENGGCPLFLHPDFGMGQSARLACSCAPLTVLPAKVEPIWRALMERAGALGWAPSLPVAMTDDPALYLLTGTRRLKPSRIVDGRYMFAIPPGMSVPRLISRAARPCDDRPWHDDRRSLGVCVRRLTWRTAHTVQDIAMDDPTLADGWWMVEDGSQGNPVRWTTGYAALPCLDAGVLTIEVAATIRYAAHATVLQRGGWVY